MNITNNESAKMQIFRKQINKIMNLNMLKNFEKLPNIDTIISLYSSKKSYISPKQKHLINNKNKEIKRNISPNNQKSDKNSQKQNNFNFSSSFVIVVSFDKSIIFCLSLSSINNN